MNPPAAGETDALGLARKRAMQRAWKVMAGLAPRAVPKRLRVSRSLLYGYLSERRANQPPAAALRSLATLFREHAVKLEREAAHLDDVASRAT